MSNCALNFAFANEEELFLIKEDTCGVLKKPTGSNRAYTVGPAEFPQEQEFLDDEQIRATASRFSPIKGRKMPGEWSFNTYVKPSGTPGTAPEHDVLFECALGTKTINVGTSVVYTLADQLDSFSLWIKKGHTVFALRGCTVQQPEFGIEGNAIAGISWSGNFMNRAYAGTVTATGTYSGGEATITLPGGAAQRYTEGMYINVGADTNTGAGYRITGVNYTNDTLAITPVIAGNPGVTPQITPWLPTASAEVGEPVHGKNGMVTIGGEDTIVLSAKVTLNNNIKYYSDEKNNQWTAERFGRPGKREVDGEVELYFLKPGDAYFYRAEYQVSNALVIPAGNVSGYIMQISIPYAEYRTPTISGDEEFVQNVPFIGRCSATLNDELAITFL